MKKLVINLAEEIYDYVGDSPEGSWDHDLNIAEYGTPDEIAINAAYNFFAGIDNKITGDTDPHLDIGIGCYTEPHDEFYLSVLNTLNLNAGKVRELEVFYMTDVVFNCPNLILELSTKMDMSRYHEKLKPPRS